MNKGFTTIEMLVVVGVIGLLSAILITYSRSGERQIIIFKEQARIISVLSRVKSLSIATFGKTCGYGVHFEAPRIFLIFKDLAASGDCSLADKKYSGANEIFESFNLDSAVEFSQLTLSDVIFIPPNPSVVIDNDPSKIEDWIKIKTIDGQSERTIKVTNVGQITAQ